MSNSVIVNGRYALGNRNDESLLKMTMKRITYKNKNKSKIVLKNIFACGINVHGYWL